MENVFKGIKRDNIEAIYNIALSDQKYTRGEIAEITKLSLATVTKVIDGLCQIGIVKLVYSDKVTIGRRSRYVTLNKERFCVVYDLSG